MTDAVTRVLKKLQDRQKEEGKLPLFLDFYQKLVQAQASAQKRLTPPAITLGREEIKARTARGQPLAGFDELNLDLGLARQVFTEVVAIFAAYPPLFGELPESLKKPGAGRQLTGEVARAWFTGKELPSKILDGASENLMLAIIQATLQPFLASYAKAAISSVEQDLWRRGYCPICGGSPDLASLKGENGARWLLCSRCDAEWLFQRLECPYCGTQEQSALAFFTDDKELYRLYVCGRCKCYLKAIDLRKTETEVSLPLERLYTIDLDKQAAVKGYHSCQKPTLNIK